MSGFQIKNGILLFLKTDRKIGLSGKHNQTYFNVGVSMFEESNTYYHLCSTKSYVTKCPALVTCNLQFYFVSFKTITAICTATYVYT